MKKILFIAIIVMSSYVAFASAAQIEPQDDAFAQKRMLISGRNIYVASSFKDQDHVTKYDVNGKQHWNAPFFAKILSWEIIKQGVIVFSKKRDGSQTYLTLINHDTGKVIWQRP